MELGLTFKNNVLSNRASGQLIWSSSRLGTLSKCNILKKVWSVHYSKGPLVYKKLDICQHIIVLLSLYSLRAV